MNIQQFITKNNIKMTVKPRLANPLMDSAGMDHWTCHLTANKKKMSLAYSMGSGHKGREPRLDEVLECLASDVNCVDSTFANFCNELGYNQDSRKAERIYKACKRLKVSLVRLVDLDELSEVDF